MTVLEEFRRQNVERIQSTRLVQSIIEGRPEKHHYIGYLVNVYNYAQHSPTVIALAASRCVQTHPELGRYLFRHAEEEIGHEHWALSDLKDFGLTEDRIQQTRPTPACLSMIALEYYVAGTWNPVALFGWLYALESLGDAMGTILSNSLSQGLQLSGKAVYFLEGHGEADHHHTRDLEEQIARHVTNSKDLDDILYIAEISSGLYARMIEEVGERGARLPEDTIRTGRLRCDLDDVAYQYASFENGQVVGCVRVVDLKDIRQDNALIAKYRLHEVINTWGRHALTFPGEWRSQKNSEIGHLPFAS